MRAVVQRCDGAAVEVGGERVGGFEGPGLTVLVGVARTDSEQQARKLAAKVWGLRLFEAERYAPSLPLPSLPFEGLRTARQAQDGATGSGTEVSPRDGMSSGGPSAGPRELSASDLGLPLLVISQFTLYGRTEKGRRPTWEDAAPGPQAQPLVDAVVAELRRLGAGVSVGVFGADMAVRLTNDGPFTVLVDI